MEKRKIQLQAPSDQTEVESNPKAGSEKKRVGGFGTVFFWNFAFFVYSLCYFPIFLSKIRQARSRRTLLKQRWGLFKTAWRQNLEGKQIFWIHAVSVGEVMAVRKFLDLFLERFEKAHIVFTTVTPTGQSIAKEFENERITVAYFPFDFTASIRNFLSVAKPQCLLLTETEVWPNLMIETAKQGIPVGILNARLSKRSTENYTRFKFLFQKLFARLDFVLTQTEEDAIRFEELGVLPERVHVLGNMKFDNVSVETSTPEQSHSLRARWHFKKGDLIWIAGSTHPGEEEILLRALLDLREKFPSLKMVMAPRHIERCEKLQSRIQKQGLEVELASHLLPGQQPDVLILDQLGILKSLYAMADIVFMGGSLIQHGGQNPIEPASHQRAIIHGPHFYNFERVYRELSQEGGALLVRDEDELLFALERLLEHQGERELMGQNAFRVIGGLQGATERHLQWIQEFFEKDSQERITSRANENLLSSSRRGT